MAKLIYATNVSLDGYIEDERGVFDLFPPDDDVFASTTDLLRSLGTFLYGRRLYETMAVWETNAASPRSPTSWPTSRQPGKQRTKSSTRQSWPRCQPQCSQRL